MLWYALCHLLCHIRAMQSLNTTAEFHRRQGILKRVKQPSWRQYPRRDVEFLR
jgi:hypothetical protein